MPSLTPLIRHRKPLQYQNQLEVSSRKRWRVNLPLLTARSCSCMTFRGEEGTPDAQSALLVGFVNGGRKLFPMSGWGEFVDTIPL
jgi:hypothetical protein